MRCVGSPPNRQMIATSPRRRWKFRKRLLGSSLTRPALTGLSPRKTRRGRASDEMICPPGWGTGETRGRSRTAEALIRFDGRDHADRWCPQHRRVFVRLRNCHWRRPGLVSRQGVWNRTLAVLRVLCDRRCRRDPERLSHGRTFSQIVTRGSRSSAATRWPHRDRRVCNTDDRCVARLEVASAGGDGGRRRWCDCRRQLPRHSVGRHCLCRSVDRVEYAAAPPGAALDGHEVDAAVRFTRFWRVRYDCSFAPAPVGATGGSVLDSGGRGGWNRPPPPLRIVAPHV